MEYKTLRIPKAADLPMLEKTLRELEKAERDNVNVAIWIPRRFASRFFCEDLLVATIATASRSARNLKVVDWGGIGHESSAEAAFSGSLHGLAALTYAPRIANERDDLFVEREDGGDVSTFRDTVIRKIVNLQRSRLEPAPDQSSSEFARASLPTKPSEENRSLTFCAFDPNYARIRELDERDPQRFMDRLHRFRREFCERGSLSRGYSEREHPDDLKALGTFVFQLFQNTYEHGRSPDSHASAPSLRYFRISKINSVNKTDLLPRAQGFPELERYLEKTANPKGNASFYYSISVFDSGMGILDHFQRARPDLVPERAVSITEKLDLLNQIVRKNLSGKPYVKGAGLGLEITMEAIRRLNGFLTVRTSDIWATASGEPKHPFAAVQQSEDLARIDGTVFNLIFPLHDTGRG